MAELQTATADFVDRVLLPAEAEAESTGQVPPAVIEAMKAMGVFGLRIPTAFGGLGLDVVAYVRLLEELGRAHAAFRSLIQLNNGMGSRCLVTHGTDEQKQRYLPGLAGGDLISAFALSEPEAGSDAASIQLRAERRGDGYVLQGVKHFVTNAPLADCVTLLARTGEARGAEGTSLFIVDRNTPGMEILRIQRTMGPEAYQQAELAFDDCPIPATQRIGPEGAGLRIALGGLTEGRVALAMACVGAGRRLLDEARRHAEARVQFGKPIVERQAIRFMLADMAVDLFAARAATMAAARQLRGQSDAGQAASMAKLVASEAVGRIADRAVQIGGAMGYARDLPIERIFREARLYRILEGTSEIQRLIIARQLLQS